MKPLLVHGMNLFPFELNVLKYTRMHTRGSRALLYCSMSSSCRLTRVEAARKIERFWCSYRDKQMFKLLKYAICAAVSFCQIN